MMRISLLEKSDFSLNMFTKFFFIFHQSSETFNSIQGDNAFAPYGNTTRPPNAHSCRAHTDFVSVNGSAVL